MKSVLMVKLVNDKFTLVEQKQVIQEVELASVDHYDELGPIIESTGFKNAKATDEVRTLIKEQRKAARLANDTKRQERLAAREAKKAAQVAKIQARIEKLQNALAKNMLG
jgi:hypothetical protein